MNDLQLVTLDDFNSIASAEPNGPRVTLDDFGDELAANLNGDRKAVSSGGFPLTSTANSAADALAHYPTFSEELMTDVGNAEVFALLYPDRLRFAPQEGRAGVWLHNDNGRWRRDEFNHARLYAMDVGRLHVLHALNSDELTTEQRGKLGKHGLRTLSNSYITNMLALASAKREFVVDIKSLDGDPWLLGCANGVVDLRSGGLRPYDADDLITRGNEIVYDPEATCPRWIRFLQEVFQARHDLIAYFRRAVGYTLTGDTRERKLFLLHGPDGWNGKTTTMNVLSWLLGELACTTPFDTFLHTKNEEARKEIAAMEKMRFVYAIETDSHRRIDAGLIKRLTGRDPVKGRAMYKDSRAYKAEFKIWLATNELPKIKGEDQATFDRVRLIPFDERFEDNPDRELEDTLYAELSGILNWAVNASLEWQRHNLPDVDEVMIPTNEYRQENDPLGQFISDQLEFGGIGYETTAKEMVARVEQYYTELGDKRVPTAKTITQRLAKHGAEKDTSTRKYYGVRFKDTDT